MQAEEEGETLLEQPRNPALEDRYQDVVHFRMELLHIVSLATLSRESNFVS